MQIFRQCTRVLNRLSGGLRHRIGRRVANEQSLEACLAVPEVLIELTSRCNFACTYCSSAFKERPKVDMPMELFRHLVGQLPGLTNKVLRMHVDGEPTLHPQFVEMIRMINEQGLRAVLATNGSRLDPAFLDLEMDLLISISTCAEDFRQRHRTINYEDYCERILNYLRAWLKTENRQYIWIQIPFALGRQDDSAYARRKQDAVALIVEALGLPPPTVPISEKPYRFRKSEHESLEFYRWDIFGQGLYPVDGKRGKYEPAITGFCDSPWKRLAVLADGRVSCCCTDLSGGTSFTKPEEIWQMPLAEIWRSHPGILAIRRSFLERRVPLEVCRRCLSPCPNHEVSHTFLA
jgi:organic radical activating enzyme